MTLHKLTSIPLIIMTLTTFSQAVQAACTTLIKGPVAILVKECKAIVPETTFASRDSKYNFIRDLPPANRKQFMETYRGVLVTGPVTQSQAIRQGMSVEKGALLGESISALIPAVAGNCETTSGHTIEVDLTQACCDGGGEAPCLLDTGYVLRNVKLSDPKATGKDAAGKRSPEIQALYAKAKQAISVHDLRGAAVSFEQIRSKGELDVASKFKLGIIYRELDKCALALPVLEELQHKFETKDYWTDTEGPVRKGTFLYARCLSVTGKTNEAVLVLQGFLVEKSRYRKEILESLSHKDFGYMHTSKSFINYKKNAEKLLKTTDDEN
ncbi:MAG: hypothetical protein H7249_17610 [Chitinophagaceae bacterium]|nr:hypothetical protein [Oligoflexus sp.]